MNFMEAIAAMKEGKTVTRSIWLESDGYLIFMKNMRSIWKITIYPSVNAGNNLFTVEDFDAQDWQVSNGCNENVIQAESA